MRKKPLSIYLNEIQMDFVKSRARILELSVPEYMRKLIDREIDLYLNADVDSDFDRKNTITRKGNLI